ncbi:hypothetical protein Taro_054916 [Colocasia esculenta]|uniref:Alpha/beta hydrolase fold-3 domain-containing protein n=1 Tax=Colocasia esculenta TaxID=4460 RepID=A0A843XQ46_COLES|nr:hypothetical protein [Colocasia esculenta]
MDPPTSASATAYLTFPWMTKPLFSFISFVIRAMEGSPINLLGFLSPPWKATELFAYVVPFLADAVKAGSNEALVSTPPIPWRTRLCIAMSSLAIDAVRRPDGTVRRFLSLLDVTVGPDASPARGVRTADVPVDPSRGLWFRLFLPALHQITGTGKLPIVVFFHGGGFAFFSPASWVFDAFCRRICHQTGAAVVSVNYRLAPEHRCPAPYVDGVDVLRFLDSYPSNSGGFRHGGPSGGKLLQNFFEAADLSKCFVVGDSAGGNIAHHVAHRWTAGGPPLTKGRIRLVGLVVIQPFFGGESRVESEVRLARDPLLLVNTERTDWLWRVFLPMGACRDHEASNPAAAVEGVGDGFPPAMVVVGGLDPLKGWQTEYVESLRKMEKEAMLVEYPDALHGFIVLPGLGASVATLVEEMRMFIQKHLPTSRAA